jgi:hypothetical protein
MHGRQQANSARIAVTTGRWGTLARFLARLASISSLNNRQQRDQLALADELERVVHGGNAPVSGTLRGIDRKRKAAIEEISRRILPAAHASVRGLLNGVLEGNVVPLPHDQLPQSYVNLENGVLVERLGVQKPIAPLLLFNLLTLMRQRPFPFGRCPVCRNVFVRVRRQKYCSPSCTYKGVEAARKEKRREYMRALMRDRRAATRRR